MTQELVFLFIGYAVIWVLLFGYLVFVTGAHSRRPGRRSRRAAGA